MTFRFAQGIMTRSSSAVETTLHFAQITKLIVAKIATACLPGQFIKLTLYQALFLFMRPILHLLLSIKRLIYALIFFRIDQFDWQPTRRISRTLASIVLPNSQIQVYRASGIECFVGTFQNIHETHCAP